MNFFEFSTNGRYHRDMKILKVLASNSKQFRVYGIFKNGKLMMIGEGTAKYCIFLNNLCLTSGLKNSPGYVFSLRKLKNDIKIALNYWYWAIGKPIKIYHAVYICEKKDVALQLSKVFFNSNLLNNLNLIWWKYELNFFLGSLTIFHWSETIFHN